MEGKCYYITNLLHRITLTLIKSTFIIHEVYTRHSVLHVCTQLWALCLRCTGVVMVEHTYTLCNLVNCSKAYHIVYDVHSLYCSKLGRILIIFCLSDQFPPPPRHLCWRMSLIVLLLGDPWRCSAWNGNFISVCIIWGNGWVRWTWSVIA